ncbi:NADH-ubiquinone oxidoreductase chain E [Liberibacter crescens BT-1]|uniref:NADH-ubiquinone oxidoreductase chain E n=1 Tax=Liberibacter crescens (strain BT-1) TaxID=1215343 RepID=L0ERX8_LIBCB|nr:NADH-quinone oxidoreductase subunit NuoE [Liberibacter crescens]AGA64254.1 NADH-ubiquinone oxidoreductase chain E [Liberibacter crescens BT-1]
MSVRRLAEEKLQPSSFVFSEDNVLWAQKTIKKYPPSRHQSAVIPLLMRAQEQEGWVSRAAIEVIADMLGMAYIRVLEIATFYTQFQLKPVGSRAHIQVCGTTPCMLRGSEALIEVCRNKIHPDPLRVNSDGTVSWEEVECLGACVNAPMVMIGKDTYEDLTPERLEVIVDAFVAGKGVMIPPGPQIDRIYSSPSGGLTTLHEEVVEVKSNIVLEKNKPAFCSSLFIERPSIPDDLTKISGISVDVEKALNDIGVFTFSQIAKWNDEESDWIDNHLGLGGRIKRETWSKQARLFI